MKNTLALKFKKKAYPTFHLSVGQMLAIFTPVFNFEKVIFEYATQRSYNITIVYSNMEEDSGSFILSEYLFEKCGYSNQQIVTLAQKMKVPESENLNTLNGYERSILNIEVSYNNFEYIIINTSGMSSPNIARLYKFLYDKILEKPTIRAGIIIEESNASRLINKFEFINIGCEKIDDFSWYDTIGESKPKNNFRLKE